MTQSWQGAIFFPVKHISITAYKKLLARLIIIEKSLIKKYKKDILCKNGCSKCCELGTVFAIEYDILRKAVDKLSQKKKSYLITKLNHSNNRNCPLLINQSCAVYKNRPVICRTHGYPLLIKGKLSYCRMNFKHIKAIGSDCVIDLNSLNTALAAINIAYMREKGMETLRLPLKNIILEIGRE